jgi:hypothetical protein
MTGLEGRETIVAAPKIHRLRYHHHTITTCAPPSSIETSLKRFQL